MAPEEKREDDIFEVEDVDDTPPPQEFKRPKWLLDLEKKKEADKIELKSGAASGKPPPLAPGQPPARPAPSAPSRPHTPAPTAPVPPPAPRGALPPRAPTPTPPTTQVRTERPAPKPVAASPPMTTPEIRTEKPRSTADPKALAALSSAIEQAEIRKQKGEPTASADPKLAALSIDEAEIRQQKAEPPEQRPRIEVPGEFDVKQDQTKGVRPALKPLEGPVEVRRPASETRPKPAPLPQMEGELQIVKDVHAKTPQSDRLKVTKPRKLIGVVDTTFARTNMGDAAEDELRTLGGEYDVLRRTVPGIKDLAVECKILLEEEDCDLVVACGMVGGQPIDKQCAHEASLAIQWAMLATNRHILEVFVHEDEAKNEAQLAWLMERRTREHAANAHWMVQDPSKLRELAGQGLRQGFDDAGPIRRT